MQQDAQDPDLFQQGNVQYEHTDTHRAEQGAQFSRFVLELANRRVTEELLCLETISYYLVILHK